MAVLISQSASTVKKPTKNSVQFKATKKLLVEDDLHEAEVARGELFYLDETKAGCFLYDPDPSGVFYKFKITKKAFKQLSKDHTLVVREQKPHPKKPTPSKTLIPESPAYKGKITTTAPDVRLLAKKLSDFDPAGKFAMQKNGTYVLTSKRAAQLPSDLMQIANDCNVTYLGPSNAPGRVLFIPNTNKGSFTRINSSLKGGSKVGTFSGDVSILKKLTSVYGAPSNAATDGKAFNSYTFKTGSYVFSVYQWKVLDNTVFTINSTKFDEKALSKFALFLGTNLYKDGEEPIRKSIKLADLQKSMEELNSYLVENYIDVKAEKRHGGVVEFTFTSMGMDIGGVMASFSPDGEAGMYIDSPHHQFKAIQKILANFPGNSVDQDLNTIRLPEYALMHLSNMELSAARILDKASKGESFLPENLKPVPPAERISKDPKSNNSFDPQNFLDTKPKQNRIVKEALTIARKLGFEGSITVDELGSGEWVYLTLSPKGKPAVEGLITLKSPTSPPIDGNFRIRVNHANVPVVDDVYPAEGFEGAIQRVVKEMNKYPKKGAKKGAKKGEKLYMAYNHNGTPLMNEPGTYSQAEKEARDYDAATGNGSYIDEA